MVLAVENAIIEAVSRENATPLTACREFQGININVTVFVGMWYYLFTSPKPFALSRQAMRWAFYISGSCFGSVTSEIGQEVFTLVADASTDNR